MPDTDTVSDSETEKMEEEHSLVAKLSAALFYGLSSFFIIVANKVVLTSYGFPSFQVLGLSQMLTGIVVLYTAKLLKLIEFPDFARDTIKRIWPLPLVYVGNLLCGLGGTQKLSLPMFTVLRRFSILFTMIAEFWILGIKASRAVQLSVYLMMLGAIIAGLTDLSFDAIGYLMIFVNNICTATNMVYTKQKLEAKDLGKYGLLFYNALFMIFPVMALSIYTEELQKAYNFQSWTQPMFLLQFGLSCILGFVLNYSIVLCTHINSALTTTIIGVLKNLLVTYIGMALGGDYIFSWPNFIGLNISVTGSLIYTYLTFKKVGPSKTIIISNGRPPQQV
ncbi:UDP-N-acetylglucosamine/UDP-glucose/GDP-mannose transporter-like [Mercenaria mercenaria]|uniref:UDP-N-acetylglucosamine/UDP-glucose/GDP-mannose transporter-like n=1 Tax=Mercenaria mercenaria TaxID=6596 RepID=UPI001E1D384F|nr:UDP-N-acetylglucosamine/UDP-glucose/GDP-mannose transporter-like [Mercenaria mercenaria]